VRARVGCAPTAPGPTWDARGQINGSTVVFSDGTRGDYDVIVLCTGYRVDLPFLEPAVKELFVDEDSNSVRLYKNVFCPQIGPSLAFIGFLQPTSGGLLTMSEIQARAAAPA
jgi:dimethylaniline monooxygenase (N-oxide forming)